MDKLYHFSEDPTITRFVPRPHPSHPALAPAVWAINEEHASMYFLPRDCPRIAYHRLPDSTEEDVQRFLGLTTAQKVIVIENRWYPMIMETTLYEYTFAPEPFYCLDKHAGYYLSHEAVMPVAIQPVGDLIGKLCDAGVELRFTPSLLPLKVALLSSSLHYSMIRLRNAIL